MGKWTILFNLFFLPLFLQALSEEELFSPTQPFLPTVYANDSVDVITGEYCEIGVDVCDEAGKVIVGRGYRSGSFSFLGGWEPSLPEEQDPREEWAFRLRETGKGYSVHTRTGDRVSYVFEEDPVSGLRLLREVDSTYSLPTRYEYGQVEGVSYPLLVKHSLPGDSYLLNAYYALGCNDVGGECVVIEENDWRLGRVREQRAPVGRDSSPVLLATYFYESDTTTVVDGCGNKTVYRIDARRRVCAIEQYAEEGVLYRAERLFWEEESEQDRLRFRFVVDGQGYAFLGKEFVYDDRDNIVEERIWGDGDSPFCLGEGEPILEGGVSCQTTLYFYEEGDQARLVEKIDPSGLRLVYAYGEDRVASLFVYEGERLLFRYFYTYNDERWLTTMITDDGVGADAEDFDGVTERKIFRTTYGTEGIFFGKTLRKEAWLWSEMMAEEMLVGEENFTYSPKETLVETITHDEERDFVVFRVFDQQKRLLQERSDQGVCFVYTYDERGNLVREDNTKRLFPTTHTYDCASRRIHTETTTDEGIFSCCSWRYNALGQMIAERDTYGNETEYVYDALGRCMEVIYPLVPMGEDALVRPVVERHYDIGNRLVSTRDANGFLREENRMPERKSVTFDALQRVVSEQNRNEQGEVINAIAYTYQGMKRVQAETTEGVRYRYSYDARGSLQETTIEAGEESLVFHPPLPLKRGEEENREAPFSRYPIVEYDVIHPCGYSLVVRESVDEEGTVCITYADAMGRVQEVFHKDVWGACIAHKWFFYDPNGNKIAEKHNCIASGVAFDSYRISWIYGEGDRVEEVTEYVDDRPYKRTSYFYSPEGILEMVCKPDGITLHYTYTLWDRIASICASDGSVDYTYCYDEQGRLCQIFDALHGTTHTLAYNAFGLLVEEQQPQGLPIGYSYDGWGHKEWVRLPDQSSIHYVYEERELAKIERRDSAGSLLYEHNYLERTPEGFSSRERLIGCAGEIAYSYDADGHRVGIEAQLFQQKVERDSLGRVAFVVSVDPLGIDEKAMEYDPLWQVVCSADEECVYDSLANCLSVNGVENQINGLNQQTIFGQTACRYDANGRCVAETSEERGTTYYEYDALDRLVCVLQAERTWEYQYDALGRRISKKEWHYIAKTGSWRVCREERFLYDGMQEIGSVNEKGDFLSLRLLGKGMGAEIGSAVAIEFEGHSFVPIHDYRGSVALLLDANTGECVETYRYSSFGEATIYLPQGELISPSLSKNPWRFSSKRSDEETGFVFFGQRFYHPLAKRWLTPDAAGFVDGPNLYAFVQNNPHNAIDLYGHASLGTAFKALWRTGKKFFGFASDVFHGLSLVLDEVFPFRKRAGNDLEGAFDQFPGKIFLQFTGYYLDPCRVSVYGKGEVAPDVRITLINGLFNIHEDCQSIAQWISETHGDVNVHYIFRPTRGWTWDLFHGLRIKLGHLSQQAKQLAILWREMIYQMGGVDGEGKVIHYAHSLGGTDTLYAQELLSLEERALIHVVTFGSATLTPNLFGFASLNHYLSKRDGVFLIDLFGFLGAIFGLNDDVEFVGSLWGVPLVDHLMGNDTYRVVWEELGRDFVYQYGAVL